MIYLKLNLCIVYSGDQSEKLKSSQFAYNFNDRNCDSVNTVNNKESRPIQGKQPVMIVK